MHTNLIIPTKRTISIWNDITDVYVWNKRAYRKGKKRIINQGGTYSSKTYSILQLLIDIAIENNNWIITVTGQDMPNLERGPLRIFNELIRNENVKPFLISTKLVKGPYRFKNGSIIEFTCFDTPQDAQSAKRQILYVNEINGVLQETYNVLAKKTDYTIFMDYNPSAQFYVHDDLMHKENTITIISTFLDNKFCPEDKRQELFSMYDEYIKTNSTYALNEWRVYGQGKTGVVEGLVIPHVRIMSDFPHPEYMQTWKYKNQSYKICYGLDFGYKTSPTALTKNCIRTSDSRQVIQELMYEPFNAFDMHTKLPLLGLKHSDFIIADPSHAEAIAILRRRGWNIHEAQKPPGSVKAGIESMNKHGLDFVYGSENLIKEQKSYLYQKKPGGRYDPDEPIKKNDHLIDGARYAHLTMYYGMHIKASKRTNGRRRVVVA